MPAMWSEPLVLRIPTATLLIGRYDGVGCAVSAALLHMARESESTHRTARPMVIFGPGHSGVVCSRRVSPAAELSMTPSH
jgi:hypothetical protein